MLHPRALVLPCLVAALAACERNPQRVTIDCPSTVVPSAGIEIETRRSRVSRETDGTYCMDWAGYVRNTGARTLIDLDLTLVARRPDGSEIGRYVVRVLGFHEPLGWLYPGYGTQVVNRGCRPMREQPARIDVIVSSAKPESGRAPAPDEGWSAVKNITWPKGQPPGVALEVHSRGFSLGPEGIVFPRGKVLFDCTLGIRNTGSRAAGRLGFVLHFFAEDGREVDTLGLRGENELPVQPGDTLLFTAGRGVEAHTRVEIHAEAE
jgi:hypothetical protein